MFLRSDMVVGRDKIRLMIWRESWTACVWWFIVNLARRRPADLRGKQGTAEIRSSSSAGTESPVHRSTSKLATWSLCVKVGEQNCCRQSSRQRPKVEVRAVFFRAGYFEDERMYRVTIEIWLVLRWRSSLTVDLLTTCSEGPGGFGRYMTSLFTQVSCCDKDGLQQQRTTA